MGSYAVPRLSDLMPLACSKAMIAQTCVRALTILAKPVSVH
eukprot:CAMPEP_0174695714 /NCGR_PEP_ID=MMETSP1094-20130205/2037_1 /TAXON_ID=156173 /ORGANISM="Chrysochromulina brevifilum, Strain UTEX LB 985" /LENGTH=40 /DNA_ID= /DNA_START= /DNA_END= /DNA_ORIENTATION=